MDELDALPAREIERWSRYWIEEPWGAYRDNLHAALIASELWKVELWKQNDERSKVNVADFMFEHEDDRKARSKRQLVATLLKVSKKQK